MCIYFFVFEAWTGRINYATKEEVKAVTRFDTTAFVKKDDLSKTNSDVRKLKAFVDKTREDGKKQLDTFLRKVDYEKDKNTGCG